jgi:hypothetical protein
MPIGSWAEYWLLAISFFATCFVVLKLVLLRFGAPGIPNAVIFTGCLTATLGLLRRFRPPPGTPVRPFATVEMLRCGAVLLVTASVLIGWSYVPAIFYRDMTRSSFRRWLELSPMAVCP